MRIGELPLVLQDLITELAWGKNAHETFLLACIATEVNHWNIPDVFIRMHFFDWRDMCDRQSPLKVFNACLAPADWFRDDICYHVADAGLPSEEGEGRGVPADVDEAAERRLDKYRSLLCILSAAPMRRK